MSSHTTFLRVSCLVAFLLTAGSSTRCALPADDNTHGATESKPTLKLGRVEVSHYAVKKNLARFRQTGRNTPPASPESIRFWFELYLARQVIIAEALAQGYGERAEIARIVETMERHMLTQPDGPLYAALAPATPPTAEELHLAYEQIPAPSGRPKASFEELRPMVAHSLQYRDREIAMQTRQTEVLLSSGLTVQRGVADRFVQRLQSAPLVNGEIPEEVTAPFAKETLATYGIDGERLELTAQKWLSYFNALFIRVLPSNEAQFQASLKALVVTEYDCREARRLGLDRTPQFLEDRRNFLYYQALDLFEKERLLPQIVVTADEVQAHYQSHLAEYLRPARAHGHLFRFADEQAAGEWLRSGKWEASQEGERIVVSRAQPLPGFEQATESILRMPAGRPFGPLPGPDSVAVFLKQTTDKEPQPLEAVTSQIRNEIARQRLDALELKLAREWCSRFQIEDRLEPAQFGVAGPVARPWANSATK